MRQYAWLVPALAILGFVISVIIHVMAYITQIPVEIFLFYCRAEWLGLGLVVYLLGVLMPSTTPRRQLLMMLKWMSAACVIMMFYLLYAGLIYISSDHPRKEPGRYYLVHGNRVVRTISEEAYEADAAAEHRFYFTHMNRAFSLISVVMYLGLSLYGMQYLRRGKRLGPEFASAKHSVPWWYAGG
jgi:hypothetical protein